MKKMFLAVGGLYVCMAFAWTVPSWDTRLTQPGAVLAPLCEPFRLDHGYDCCAGVQNMTTDG